ncbi:3-hydroxyisobutyryl-CoA hydrolase-like protein 5 [Camellia lanceoleosa]|uniref:3-hydroxyisobutyryl-CoA hydrolase-like protein 5 n=1 Tax=Camellia lanceoleosa TaxID=1840588 RepID=A0ACC0H654_9ERIC|nr:3-hydroxyisobutyryl-CoA hydrolase-like protein 5 [Camellia lanceoleosa]
MYWLCYHIHTYKKTHVALVHGISMGGGASLTVPMKFSVVTEKAVFSTQKQVLGFILTVVSHTCFLIFMGIWGRGKSEIEC